MEGDFTIYPHGCDDGANVQSGWQRGAQCRTVRQRAFPDLRPTCVRMPKPGSQPANRPVIRFVTAMLNFASHRLRKRIRRMPLAGMATIKTKSIEEGSFPETPWRIRHCKQRKGRFSRPGFPPSIGSGAINEYYTKAILPSGGTWQLAAGLPSASLRQTRFDLIVHPIELLSRCRPRIEPSRKGAFF